ncbi:U32 family peptidase [bacterium]|nr:U32 family peptidase [bacterium]
MKLNTDHIEILAPAGSFESLSAALNAGCNSVFLGIADFNMRASAASNFTLQDLPTIVKKCHKKDVKVYITINTLLFDNEITKMQQIVDAVKKHKVDAIIASDTATLMYAKKVGVEAHISTQLSVSNTESVKFYSQFSTRIVLARELNLEQVAKICSDIKKQKIKGPTGKLVEIEVFAHGALCVAVSGRCAMSLHCYNTSANKGKCAQVCRHRYKVTDIDTNQELVVDNNFIMSSSDLCTVGMLPQLVQAGVKVLKFEGRGRPAEYVDTVISTYKEALKSISEGTFNGKKVDKWNKDLGTVFNRGFTQNFYMGRKMDEWAKVYGSKATKQKELAGDVEKYFSKIKVVQVKANIPIKSGAEFLITGPTTGAVTETLKDIVVNEKVVKTVKKGTSFTFVLDKKVRPNDKFYIVTKRLVYQDGKDIS